MPLPALSSSADIRSITERVNRMIRELNRTPAAGQASADTFPPIYAADTGSATAYAIAPVPGIEQYVVGQIFAFTAANANSGATPTLNVNGLGAGTITRLNGNGLSAGDITANRPVAAICTATTPAFALLTPTPLFATQTFLAADVALNNTGSFFNGPNTGSIGASGQKWRISAAAQLNDTAGAAQFRARIHDGTNPLVGQASTSAAAGFLTTINLEIDVTLSAATTFTLQAQDPNSTSGTLLTSATVGVSNKSTWIRAERLS